MLAAKQHAPVHPHSMWLRAVRAKHANSTQEAQAESKRAIYVLSTINPVALLQEWGKRGTAWASLIQPGRHSAITLDRPLTPFEVCCGLLVPLYVGRALEEAYFGKDARTLMTSDEVSS